MTIRNTTADMYDGDHSGALLFLAESMGPGGSNAAIERMEADGQHQLLTSHLLPTDSVSPAADYLALGFTFGDPVPNDPLFRPATLPPGWEKKGSDHPMWSYIYDELGRQRVSIFYKAAFYDRKAWMRLTSVDSYVELCRTSGQEVISDDTWATPEAISQAGRIAAGFEQERIDLWGPRVVQGAVDDYATERLEAATAARDAYLALAAGYELLAQPDTDESVEVASSDD